MEGGAEGGSGMGRTRKMPMIIGKAVPSASMRRNVEVSPGKNTWERVEKRKAERPNPERTRPTVVARFFFFFRVII